MTEPKPCPFCGCAEIEQISNSRYAAKWGWMSCKGCGVDGPQVFTHYHSEIGWREAAITEWNRRAPQA